MVWHKYWGPTKRRLPIVLHKWLLLEENMHEWPLRVNHYDQQSVEHYIRMRSKWKYGITSTRRNQTGIDSAVQLFLQGSVVGSTWDRINNSVMDDVLSRKGHWKRLGKQVGKVFQKWERKAMVVDVEGMSRDIVRTSI